MKRIELHGTLMFVLAFVLAMPGYAQDSGDVPGASEDGLRDRLEGQHDELHQNLREQLAALRERLANADLRPAQKRRIYNAMTDQLQDRHDAAHDRFRRVRDAADEGDVRPGVRPEARPASRPEARRPGPSQRPPVARPAVVARTAARR